MTYSEIETFEKELFSKLIKNSSKSIKIIEKNKSIIDFYLNGKNLAQIKKFVDDFNDVVTDKKVKKYKIFETVLKHPLFSKVLEQFRQSDVLVKACRNVEKYYILVDDPNTYNESVNKDLIKWLLTMNINYAVQDELGRTALMYAVKYEKLDFAVKEMMNGKHIHLLDKDGNSVLFHATETFKTLDKFVKYKDLFDNNHVNYNNENLILYCARNKKINCYEYFKVLKKYNCIYPNMINNHGKTAAMYFVIYGQYKELQCIMKDYNIDPNFVNSYGNSLSSVLIKNYYDFYYKTITTDEGFGLNMIDFKRYALTFKVLAELGCDFRIPIDEEGTTVFDILSKLKDEVISKYIFNVCCNDYIVQNHIQRSNKRYPEIDISNKIIEKNYKTVNMWLTEALFPSGTINTRKTGLIMLGLF